MRGFGAGDRGLLTNLEFVLEQVFLVGHLAVETEEFLLLRGHGLGVLGDIMKQRGY